MLEVPQTIQPPRGVKRYVGRVIYIYAFDVAYDMLRLPLPELLGQPVAQFSVDASRRNPRHMFFYRPQMIRLPPMERIGPNGPVRIERSLKLLPVGALSITVSVPFDVGTIADLVEFHDLEFSNGQLSKEVRQIAEEARRELARYCIKPVAQLADEEAYTVFCIDAPLVAADGQPLSAEDWLQQHRRDVAALLTQESDVNQLSRQEADESTGRYLSYYENDLAVLDWDAALIVQEPGQLDEILYVLELANLQLAELEAYDRILDTALERSYRDLTRQPRRSRELMRELREIRVDLARFSDELSNITKFFGDWHLARLYENIAARFHLGDWHRTIDEKLKTLDDLYTLLSQDRINQWMLTLEVTIVLLFIVDLILLVMGLKRP
ncbi:MAG TPA: hypothetical protein VGR14_12345 [Verrucomicrobiae bacterium]|jgi:hypothetical protein|nr:hypothetical protein [Verrucomicrobiae bacterium]